MARPRRVTVASLAFPFSRRRCSAQVTLALGGVTIGVRSDSTLLVEELTGYFAPFVVPGLDADILVTALEKPGYLPALDYKEKTPDPGKTRVKEDYVDLPDGRVVRKRLTGMVFLMSSTRNFAVGPCLANVNQVVNFVNSRYIEHLLRRGGLLCHASAAVGQKGAIAIAGRPGAGKSTLALHLLEQGFDFVSNDRLVVSGRPGALRAYGVPKLPRINPGTIVGQPRLHSLLAPSELAEAGALSKKDLWRLERKYDVPLDALYGPGRFQLEAPVRMLLILEWTRSGGRCAVEAFDPARRPDLLEPLVKSPGLFLLHDPPLPFDGGSDLPDTAAYGRLLAGIPAFRFSGGVSFESAIEMCRYLVKPLHSRPGDVRRAAFHTSSSKQQGGVKMGHDLKVKGSMSVERAAGYLSQLAASLTAGTVTVQRNEEAIVLKPVGPVWLEVEAERGKSKETLSLELSWASGELQTGADELIISSEPPVIVAVYEAAVDDTTEDEDDETVEASTEEAAEEIPAGE